MPEEITIHVFACGQGDTLLLSLRDKWVLVDCNLPAGEVRSGFFAKLDELGVQRLDVLCLTHSHHDHYHGMEQVVEHFTTGGRSLGIFCDGGVDPEQVIAAIKGENRTPHAYVSEHERLYEKLSDLIVSGRVRRFVANRDSRPVLRQGTDLYMLPVGPSSQVLADTTLQATGAGDWTSTLRKRINQLSVVLALCVRSGGATLDALLAADTDGPGLNDACRSLDEFESRTTPGGFDLVKVPHHGSLDSHDGSNVCQRTKLGERLAVICCNGESKKLPDRIVIRAFLDAGWQVLPTARRVHAPVSVTRSSSLLTMSGKSPAALGSILVKNEHLEITWSATNGLRFHPPDAAIARQDVNNYGTAQKAVRSAASPASQAPPLALP